MRLLHSISLIALLTQYGCIENCTEPNPWATDVLEMTVPDLTEPDMAEPSEDLRVPRCNANSDCPLSGLCLDTGYFNFPERPGDCVRADRITYVDIASTSAMPDGTKSSPFHTIAEALQAVLAAGEYLVVKKPYVLVAGSSMPYKDKVSVKFSDNMAQVVLIGPWADPALTPRRPAKTDELVYWAKNSMQPATITAPLLIESGKVWIDGLSFRGMATESGINCIKSESLSIQRTKIESYKYGVSHESNGNYCSNILINRSSIFNNTAAGVYVIDSTGNTIVKISNSCISKNGDSGIVATRVLGLQVVHSTIAANGKANMPFGAIRFTPGRLTCSICGSLLAGNSSSPADMGSGQQNCQDIKGEDHPNKEVSKISDGGLEFNSDFLLFDPDSAPMSRNYDFIDKMTKPCGSDSLDYVGTNRPKGQNKDYGMHEVWWNNPSDGGLP